MTNKVDSSDDLTLDDLVERGWLRRAFGDITRESAAKQVIVGGGTGWLAGYTFSKVGRAAAAAIGGSLLLLQVAHHQGLIQINWNKVDRSVQKAKKTLARDVDKMVPHLTAEVRDFVQENMVLAGGFAGGFLLGLAM